MAKTQVTLNHPDAVDLLNKIETPWAIKGAGFFNDYASLIVEIDGMDTPHRLILRRDGTWKFTAQLELE